MRARRSRLTEVHAGAKSADGGLLRNYGFSGDPSPRVSSRYFGYLVRVAGY